MTEQQKEYKKILDENNKTMPRQGTAFALVKNIGLAEGVDLTDEQFATIGAAIKVMLDATSIMSITKEELRTVIKFLWNNLFEWEENDGN